MQIIVVMLFAATVLGCDIIYNAQTLIQYQPRLLHEVKNGQRLLIGNVNDPQGNFVHIAKLKGTAFEMGYAFGQLFAQQIKANLNGFYEYQMENLESILEQKLPAFLAQKLTSYSQNLLKKILDLNVLITKRYTNPRYFEEINGIAKGAKISPKQLLRLNIFPQLIKAACTIAGVWGKATVSSQTLHLRALDWDAANPINKYPIVVVYQPSDSHLQPHANMAWVGFVGSLTGVSQKISVGEKVWMFHSGTVPVPMTRYGNPWTYVLRDVLYQATNINQAISILSNTHRTCAIHLGIASSENSTFRMFEYSYRTLNIYDDTNYTYTTSHPKKEGIAYFDKHVQPSNDTCVGQVLTDQGLYGHWTDIGLWRTLGKSHKTGNAQLAVFNLQEQVAYLSYSWNVKNGSKTNTQNAYDRRPIKLDMKDLFMPF